MMVSDPAMSYRRDVLPVGVRMSYLSPTYVDSFINHEITCLLIRHRCQVLLPV